MNPDPAGAAEPVGAPAERPIHVVVMGVSGCGKTSVAEQLAAQLGLEFIEGDSHHPDSNVAKMSAGTPLTDEDRFPWLKILAGLVEQRAECGVSTVLTCSALRRRYRDILRSGTAGQESFFVHLHGSFEVLLHRMETRQHFMPPSLLQSQFDTLEPLEDDEAGAVVDVDQPLESVVADAVAAVRAYFG